MSDREEESPFVDPDADFSADERAAAAVVLAAVEPAPRNELLELKLRRDAAAFLGARRQPRAVTTTSGAEVVIADDEDRARPSTRGAALRIFAWVAVAACVGLGVFFVRSNAGHVSAARGGACAPPDVNLALSAGGDITVDGLTPPAEGMRYVLWLDGPEPVRLATFRGGSTRGSLRESAGGLGVARPLAAGQSIALSVSLEPERNAEPQARPALVIAHCQGIVQ